MRLPQGSALKWGRGLSTTLDPLRTVEFRWRPGVRARRVAQGEGWSLHMPEESTFSYPAYPFNPYAINDAAPPGEALASVSASFTKARRRTFVLEVR